MRTQLKNLIPSNEFQQHTGISYKRQLNLIDKGFLNATRNNRDLFIIVDDRLVKTLIAEGCDKEFVDIYRHTLEVSPYKVKHTLNILEENFDLHKQILQDIGR